MRPETHRTLRRTWIALLCGAIPLVGLDVWIWTRPAPNGTVRCLPPPLCCFSGTLLGVAALLIAIIDITGRPQVPTAPPPNFDGAPPDDRLRG